MQKVIDVLTPAGTGETYIPIDRYSPAITIQCDAIGTITFTVDYTLDDVVRGQANSYDVNNENIVAPASAQWTNLIASGSADVAYNGSLSARCLRVNRTVGTGQVRIRVSQEAIR